MVIRNVFSQIFARSPMDGIEQHMRKSHECASGLLPLFKALMAEDHEAVCAASEHVAQLERAADTYKSELRLHLPHSLLMPLSRSDLLKLISSIDSVANCARDIAGLLCGRQMHFPATTQALFADYLQAAVDASGQAQTTVIELNELFDNGLRGMLVEVIEKMIQELDDIEQRNDHLQVELRACLFKIERELYPVDVMFLYRIIDLIGNLANNAQDVGSRIQLIIAR